MYKRSRKTKGVSRRLAALLLCCACLFGAVSVSAIALEAEASPVTEVPARAAILEDSGTVSDNTEPAPATEAPAPTETKPPAETTAPTEAPAPTESTAPAETTVPTEAPAPAETNDPTEPETTAPAETPAPTDPEEGIAPVSETEPEPTGMADPEKDPTESGETPENGETLENEESGEPVADAPETLSVYDRLMAAATCEEAAAVFDDPENEEALLALTLAQLTNIREHINTLEEDEFGRKEFALNALDELVKAKSGDEEKEIALQRTLSITNNITNAEVAYVVCPVSGEIADAFVPVQSGVPVEVTANSGALVFFLKPAAGYLLTQYANAEGQARDLYGVSISASQSSIGWFQSNTTAAEAILKAAKDKGYVGYYGYTFYNSSQPYSDTFNISGQRPQMTVTATATPDKNLKPGDEVTFTITITPGDLPGVDEEVTRKEITSLKINGTDYTATLNTDGTYSVKYTITEEDWANQKAHLDVEAELDYKYAVGVTDRNKVDSEILTTTTIRSSASCDVQFETKKGVVYQVKFDPADKADQTKFPAAPVDSNEYFKDDTVTVDTTYNRKPVDDPVNGGTWTFDGWYHGEEKVGETLTMGEENILLVGTWKFTPYPTHELTIKKTVSGNMQDANKAFAFTVTSADKDMTYNGVSAKEFTFNLKKDESVTITVPVGAKVTVTENRNGYVQSIGSGTTIPEANRETVTDGIEFTMPDADSILIFNNDKNITVDTGILLDSLPYVLILVLVGVGAVLFLKKRHGRDDD